MRQYLLLVSAVLALNAAVLAVSNQSPEKVRAALGTTGLKSAIIEYTYSTNLVGMGSTGEGRLVYALGKGYRIERRLTSMPSVAARNQILADNGQQITSWFTLNGRTERTELNPEAITNIRKNVQRDAMVYLLAYFLPESHFFSYAPKEGGFAATSALGDTAFVSLADDKVQEVRYRRAPFVVRSTTGSSPNTSAAMHEVTVRPSDYRRVGPHLLPHKLEIQHGQQGTEQITVHRFRLNVDVPASDFVFPIGK